MSVYIVTGKLGNGKTLVTVGRIRDALRSGCRVATNLDLNLVAMFGRTAKKIDLVRIPDKPSVDDLNALGQGYIGAYDESKFGLIVLDECGTWFNSRNWQDKARKAVNDWFLHARKLRWHIYLIIQDIALLDSQARDALAEFIVFCRRLDNLRIPVIAPIIKTFTGFNPRLPRIHRAKVTYADGLVSDVWTYRGNDLFSCYKTDQLFLHEYPHAVHSVLTPWHTHGRYAVPMNMRNIMRLTKIHWRRFSSPVSLCCGLLLGAFAMLLQHSSSVIAAPEPSPHSASLPGLATEIVEENQLVMRLKNLTIVGVMTINDGSQYDFIQTNNGRPVTSTELNRAGVSFVGYGRCRVDAVIDDVTIPIYCL